MELSKEFNFFSWLLEKYAESKNRVTGDVLREWDEKGITQKIYDSYEIYHCEAIENAFEDIDHLTATGKHAY
jgi:hypothetical protein